MVELLLEDLKVRCIIGVYPRERRRKQPIHIRLVLECADTAIIHSDDIRDGVDYAVAAEAVMETAVKGEYNTLESLCWACSGRVLSDFSEVQAVTVAVYKPRALPGPAVAGVRLRRKRPE